MKISFFRALLAAAFVAGLVFVPTAPAARAGEPIASARPARVKVLTYNVHNGVGEDGVRDYARIGRLVGRSGAAVAALQEVDSLTRRSDGRDVLGEIARAAGMHPLFARAIPYDGGAYGVGILSRERPLSVRRIPLPGREEARVLLIAEFERFVFACVHLSLTEEDRMASVPTILAEAARSGKPFILAGDWNAEPGSPLLERLREGGFRIATDTTRPTYPASRPQECIDYIALYDPADPHPSARPRIELLRPRVLSEKRASDHRPVEVTLRWRE